MEGEPSCKIEDRIEHYKVPGVNNMVLDKSYA
jgi:hypothetical protein